MENMVKVDLNAFTGKRVLVTGDTGFIGAWLALWLAELGADVTGLALPPTATSLLFPAVSAAGMVRHIDCDIRDLGATKTAIVSARPEFVFHLAAQALVRRSYAEPQETFATNVLGSVNVLEAVRACPDAKALVYITSDKCYLNKEWSWGYRENDELGGRDPYSASKACAELVFRSYCDSYMIERRNFGGASARAGNVIGGGDRAADRIIPDTISALESGAPIVLRNPEATRPWQHVLDPLYGYLRLALCLSQEPKRFSGAWNFGPEDLAIRTVHDLAQEAVIAWGSGEIAHRRDPNAPHEATLLHLSSDKAHRFLKWRALWGFSRAVSETVRWYREVHDGRAVLEVSRQQIASYKQDMISP